MPAQWHRFTFVPPGSGRSRLEPVAVPRSSPAQRLAFLLCIAWVAAALAVLFLAMRAVMRLGGMVASGGPYAIAHPAPGWVWIVPLAIVTGLAAVFVGIFVGPRGAQASLLPFAWPILFVSLGWNFLEFGFHPPMGTAIAWGWVLCGLLFVPMGVLPLLAALPALRELRQRIREEKGQERPGSGAGRAFAWSLAWQLLAALAGAAAGVRLFAAMGGA